MKIVIVLLSVVLTAVASSSAVAGAKPLRDPTRPLAATGGVSGTPAPAPAPNTASGSAAANPSALPSLPRLQMVLMSNERRFAVIDGELLTEGDAVRGLRVLKIHSEAVVIATPNGPRTLPLPADNE